MYVCMCIYIYMYLIIFVLIQLHPRIPCILMLAVALAYKLREKRPWFADAMVTVALVTGQAFGIF